MPDSGSLLTRGRGTVLTVTGALGVWFLAGWLRQSLLLLFVEQLLSIPWLWTRRLTVGLLFDLPTAAVTIVVLLLANRVIAFRPLLASAALVGTVWIYDLLMAWFVSNDLSLWHDPITVAPRIVLAFVTLFGAALAMGWRPGRQASEVHEERDVSSKDDDENEPTDDNEPQSDDDRDV